MMINKILAIGAHFDDVDLGAGGTLAKWALQGKEIYKLTLTDNVTNYSDKNILVDYESSLIQSREACSVLGITQLENFFVERCTELIYNKRQMQQIESFIHEKNIDTVIAHYYSDVQQDHIGASIISYVAGRYCRNILMYQSNRYILPKDFYPRYFVNISDSIEIKRRALACYKGDHNRFSALFEMTIHENQALGYRTLLTSKYHYAEGFHVFKMVEE